MGTSEHTGTAVAAGRDASARRLRQGWCRRSRRDRGEPHDDWWSPAVEAVCAAVVEDLRGRATGDTPALAHACARLGRARARAGMGVGAALEDLAALFAEVAEAPDTAGGAYRGGPPFALVRAAAEGWAEGRRGGDHCQDPLTGLSTAAYLRTRLGELYRGGLPWSGACGHGLVVVALPAWLDPWRRTARLIVLGHELGRFFAAGETVSLLSRYRVAVVAAASGRTAERLRLLRARVGAGGDGTEVWSVPLPPTHAEAVDLLDTIAASEDGRP
ncbi:hypothetical protein [Streptomonospora nanhaiensis]|uniref:Uncharacterized protein n=1 Tax=Streptomonospora nanhaiensis TaxID=1323731 RepID=A0A853BQY3_9ACTN|nr:hypothetical protein [Streptomonospora nanhaiensis]MBV2364367.1 hypothetical protein [Streptomonospora nanhaiensis]NYI97254.1 hypothetical protein [Streptomonospora nanhaiensis]